MVKQLKQKLAGNLRVGALVHSVRQDGDGVLLHYFDAARHVTVEVRAKAVILATPRFVAQRLTGNEKNIDDFTYSPWAIANITLDALPQGKGAPLSWDNMIYDSPLLGYVVATHQISIARKRILFSLTIGRSAGKFPNRPGRKP